LKCDWCLTECALTTTQHSKNTPGSRIHRYVGQVEGQKKEQSAPVIIKGKEEWKVERILNKQRVRGKDKYLVRWKRFTVESDTWEGRENLENAKEAIEEFKRKYR